MVDAAETTTNAAQEVVTPTNEGKKPGSKPEGPEKPTKKKARRVIAPVWQVVKAGHRMFDAQLTKNQNTETKHDCLNECVSESTCYRDQLEFWLDFKTQAARLEDSKKFGKCCDERGLNPIAVAEHVAFEGSVVLNRVLRYGVEAVLGERIMMFKSPIYQDEANLYSQVVESEERGGEDRAA